MAFSYLICLQRKYITAIFSDVSFVSGFGFSGKAQRAKALAFEVCAAIFSTHSTKTMERPK